MRANALCRDAGTIGAALITLAIVLGSIVALATQGATHPNSEWVHITAGIALAGAILVAVGWIGQRMLRTVRVAEAHAETLWASATRLRDCVALGGRCDYGTGYRPREAFHAHFPEVSATLDEWDSLLGSDQACRGALNERMTREANDVGRESEGRWSLGSNIGPMLAVSTLSRAHNGELDADFALEGRDRLEVSVQRDDGESEGDYKARVDRNIGRVEALGRASQGWSEAKAVADSHQRLEAFKAERKTEVVQQLQLILEQAQPFAAKGCPTCKGMS